MAALSFGAVWRKPCSHRRSRGRGERRGAAGAKDAHLPVCHKSSGLPRDGLAAHASSLSSGTQASVSEPLFLPPPFIFPRTDDASGRSAEAPLGRRWPVWATKSTIQQDQGERTRSEDPWAPRFRWAISENAGSRRILEDPGFQRRRRLGKRYPVLAQLQPSMLHSLALTCRCAASPW